MKNKKIIQLKQSQLIDLICETVLEVSNINEAMEDGFNPVETGEIESEKNHYLDKVPDKGWKTFWKAFNVPEFIPSGKLKTIHPIVPVDDSEKEDHGAIEPNTAYQVPDGTMVKNPDWTKFEKEYGKTREEFKKDIKDEVDRAANDARDYYKSYYSDKNPDVYKKLLPLAKEIEAAGIKTKENKYQDEVVEYIHQMLDKLADGGWNWTHNGYDGGTNIWYSCDEIKKKHPSAASWSCDSWGWVSNGTTGRYTYNMNVYKFTNPTISGWKQKIYGTTVHEIGHLMQRFLEDMGISAYQYISHDRTDITMPRDSDGDRNYVDREWETYARIHQLRRVFDVTSNITAREWANLFMDKVKNGEITFYMDGIDEEANKVKKECGKKLSYTQKGTGLLVADANDIQQFLKDRKYDVAVDGGFGNETAKAILKYLGFVAKESSTYNYKELLRKMMVKQYPIFSDGIGGQAQGIIAELLYEQCKANKKTWIPPVTFELAKSGKRVIITLSKQLLTQQYSGKHGNADGVPDTFNNIWSITSDIRYNGEKFSDIAALFAKFSFDLKNFTPHKGDSKDNVYVIIDFEKIEEVNDIFVKDNMEYEFDDLTHPTDSAKA